MATRRDVVGAENRAISPAMRNQFFAQMTRQNIQTLPGIPVVPGGTTQFEIPKARLLSKISLLIEGTLTAVHATSVPFVPAVFAPFNLIRQIRVELNNGFSPFRIDGSMLMLYNQMQKNAHTIPRAAVVTDRANTVMGVTSAPAAGAVNPVRVTVKLPLTLNERDPVGLINAQNPQTVITVAIDWNALTVLTSAPAGYTFTSALTVIPVIETFTVPIHPDGVPDLSVLKLVHQVEQAITGAGDVTVRLPVGNTYRKLLIRMVDGTGAGVTDAVVGDFQIILNQADTPYRINARQLAAENAQDYGTPLPVGCWVLDYSTQGLANMGGSRDYIDTQRLTEFWLRTTAAAAGNIIVLTETMARLSG